MVFQTSSATTLSKDLLGFGVSDTGRTSSSVHGVAVLGTGTAYAFFHLRGNIPSCRDVLKMSQ